jgi:hypothetical protein
LLAGYMVQVSYITFGLLLFEELLIAWRVPVRVNGLMLKEAKEAFSEYVHEDWVSYKSFNELDQELDEISTSGTSRSRRSIYWRI